MTFLLLIQDGGSFRNSHAHARADARAVMDTFTNDLKARGHYRASDALRPDDEGVRVRVRDGQTLVVDGPFAESKEVVGGFYLIECASKAEAIELAKRCPAAEWGEVEVREIAD
ncbi:MAG: YciI family protein [Candidatus Binatia bacterium]